MAEDEIRKAEICKQAQTFGAEFIGFAPVERWENGKEGGRDKQPTQFWPQAKTVIVFGVPLWLPLVEAAPSVLGREQIIVTNKLLGKVAYRLTTLLNKQGYEAREQTAVSNVWAGYYAGLGTIGWNGALLTKKYGPRVQLKALLTDLEVQRASMIEENLCEKCFYCQKICPAQALKETGNHKSAAFDQSACLEHEKRLQKAFCDPCGSCIKVCPVGEDRELFQSNNFPKYFAEKQILTENPKAAEYQDWVHIRSYGSYALEEPSKKEI